MNERIKLLLVAGARPNFMKIAPLIRAIRARASTFEHVLVHTGQHYDEGMSDVFFRDLGIPAPHHHLNVGSGSHAEQTAKIMCEFEPVLKAEQPDSVVVFGDVNSTLACSIVAKKLGFHVSHVEAGLRSRDMTMPEEINRIVTDAISDIFFVTEQSGIDNLMLEGKRDSAVCHVGHVMIDNLFYEIERLGELQESERVKSIIDKVGPRYGIVTLHRPSNVDDRDTLQGIIRAFADISRDLPLIFPVHPRTRASIERFQIAIPSGVTVSSPMGYREFLELWRNAVLVMTDSGGLQEETTGLGVPCITLRDNTERPITVTEGTNRLVGSDPERIVEAAKELLRPGGTFNSLSRPALWDGSASMRILDVLERALKESV